MLRRLPQRSQVAQSQAAQSGGVNDSSQIAYNTTADENFFLSNTAVTPFVFVGGEGKAHYVHSVEHLYQAFKVYFAEKEEDKSGNTFEDVLTYRGEGYKEHCRDVMEMGDDFPRFDPQDTQYVQLRYGESRTHEKRRYDNPQALKGKIFARTTPPADDASREDSFSYRLMVQCQMMKISQTPWMYNLLKKAMEMKAKKDFSQATDKEISDIIPLNFFLENAGGRDAYWGNGEDKQGFNMQGRAVREAMLRLIEIKRSNPNAVVAGFTQDFVERVRSEKEFQVVLGRENKITGVKVKPEIELSSLQPYVRIGDVPMPRESAPALAKIDSKLPEGLRLSTILTDASIKLSEESQGQFDSNARARLSTVRSDANASTSGAATRRETGSIDEENVVLEIPDSPRTQPQPPIAPQPQQNVGSKVQTLPSLEIEKLREFVSVVKKAYLSRGGGGDEEELANKKGRISRVIEAAEQNGIFAKGQLNPDSVLSFCSLAIEYEKDNNENIVAENIGLETGRLNWVSTNGVNSENRIRFFYQRLFLSLCKDNEAISDETFRSRALSDSIEKRGLNGFDQTNPTPDVHGLHLLTRFEEFKEVNKLPADLTYEQFRAIARYAVEKAKPKIDTDTSEAISEHESSPEPTATPTATEENKEIQEIQTDREMSVLFFLDPSRLWTLDERGNARVKRYYPAAFASVVSIVRNLDKERKKQAKESEPLVKLDEKNEPIFELISSKKIEEIANPVTTDPSYVGAQNKNATIIQSLFRDYVQRKNFSSVNLKKILEQKTAEQWDEADKSDNISKLNQLSLLVPEVVGQEGDEKLPKIKQHNSGFTIANYRGAQGLNLFNRHVEEASVRSSESKDNFYPRVSFVVVNNFNNQGDKRYWMAVETERGISKHAIDQEQFERFSSKQEEDYEKYIAYLATSEYLQTILQVMLFTKHEIAKKHPRYDELRGNKDKLFEDLKNEKPDGAILKKLDEDIKKIKKLTKTEQSDFFKEYEENNPELTRFMGTEEANIINYEEAEYKGNKLFTAENVELIKKLTESIKKGKNTSTQRQKARVFASYNLTHLVAQEIGRWVDDNEVSVDLDKKELEEAKLAIAVNNVQQRSEGNKAKSQSHARKLSEMLDAPMAACPYNGVSILRPPGTSSLATVTFKGEAENDTAWIGLSNVNACVKVRRCDKDGPVSYYIDGKLQSREHKKGDVIIDTGVVFVPKVNGMGYDPVSFSDAEAMKRFFPDEKEKDKVQEEYKALRVKAVFYDENEQERKFAFLFNGTVSSQTFQTRNVATVDVDIYGRPLDKDNYVAVSKWSDAENGKKRVVLKVNFNENLDPSIDYKQFYVEERDEQGNSIYRSVNDGEIGTGFKPHVDGISLRYPNGSTENIVYNDDNPVSVEGGKTSVERKRMHVERVAATALPHTRVSSPLSATMIGAIREIDDRSRTHHVPSSLPNSRNGASRQ